MTFNNQGFIIFMKSGKFCDEFGHTMELQSVYDDTKKYNCKFCDVEKWT